MKFHTGKSRIMCLLILIINVPYQKCNNKYLSRPNLLQLWIKRENKFS
jgi:hypothetical protein